MKYLLILFTTICISVQGFSQSGTTRGARALYNEVTELKNGQLQIVKSTYQEFDKKGRVTLEAVFGVDSLMKSKETFAYDRKGNETIHTIYNSANQIESKILTTYNRFNEKKNVATYSGTDSLLEKTTFTYDNFGRKSLELSVDSNNKQIKKITYSYDQRGALNKRVIYDGADNITQIKQYNYTYSTK